MPRRLRRDYTDCTMTTKTARITLEDLAEGLSKLNTAATSLTEKVDNIQLSVDDLTAGQVSLQADITGLKDSVAVLEAGQKGLKADLKEFKAFTESGFDTTFERFDWLEDRFDKLESYLDGGAPGTLVYEH